MATGGALDGTGTGARTLAIGGSLPPTAFTCFAGWCGTLTVTKPVLLAAYTHYLNTQVQTVTPGEGETKQWYGPDAQGYYFSVRFLAYSNGTITNACEQSGIGNPEYAANWKSSVAISRCGTLEPVMEGGGIGATMNGIRFYWAQFRGEGGLNPSAPPNQENADIWTRSEIDGGRWASVVKPALDAAIRAAVTSADLQALGITGNPPFDQPPQARRIAIDAGHGPECPGATGPTWGDQEHVLVQEMTQQAAADFAARGHTVIQTRPTPCRVDSRGRETTQSLESRAQKAINEGAEVFVSIHLNASTDQTARGTEAWYDPRWGAASDRSLAMARLIVQEQVGLGLPTHGVGATGEPGIKLSSNKPPRDGGPFVVLTVATKDGQLPAVLDEVAFLSNVQFEEPLLHDPVFRRRAANAIENAIRRFFP